jgi:hypothetical protein
MCTHSSTFLYCRLFGPRLIKVQVMISLLIFGALVAQSLRCLQESHLGVVLKG